MNYFSSILERIKPIMPNASKGTPQSGITQTGKKSAAKTPAPKSAAGKAQAGKGASPQTASHAVMSGIAHPALISTPGVENELPSGIASDDYVQALLVAQRASARSGEWHRYRTLRMRLAQHEYARGSYRESLELLMDVWYLDLNGPRDVNRLQGAQLGSESPGFDPRMGQVSTTVQRKVKRIAAILGMSLDEMQATFFAVAGPTYRAYRLPLAPREAWYSIGAGIATA